jgi:hypothetical protein
VIHPRKCDAVWWWFASAAITLWLMLLLPAACMAHGAECSTVSGGAAIEAVSDDGSPMAYCDVEVVRPGMPDEAFQVGSTDPLGRFAFVPDTTGTWKVTVDDGMGHLAACEIEVGPHGVGIASGGGTDRFGGVIVGVAVIFGIFGLVALLYSRRRHGRACI